MSRNEKAFWVIFTVVALVALVVANNVGVQKVENASIDCEAVEEGVMEAINERNTLVATIEDYVSLFPIHCQARVRAEQEAYLD